MDTTVLFFFLLSMAVCAQVKAQITTFVQLLQQEPGYKYDYQSMDVVKTIETLRDQCGALGGRYFANSLTYSLRQTRYSIRMY